MQKILSIIFVAIFITACVSKAKTQPKLFDQVYVLSLDRTPERYKEAKENLDSAKLPHTRISAVDGYAIKVKDKITGKVMDAKEAFLICNPKKYQPEKFSYEVTCDSDPRSKITSETCLSPGELGVYCSMRKIWHDMLDHDYKKVLILEDDSRIQKAEIKTFKQQASAVIENTPVDWDVIFFHMYHSWRKVYPARKIGTNLENEYVWGINRDPKRGVASCAAYVVNREFAKKMLKYTETIYLPIDVQISNAIIESLITGYYTKKKIIIPDEAGANSVIQSMGRKND